MFDDPRFTYMEELILTFVEFGQKKTLANFKKEKETLAKLTCGVP